ncbi:MAG: hypothetical protein R2832_12895 [Rhodothermales bacterium]
MSNRIEGSSSTSTSALASNPHPESVSDAKVAVVVDSPALINLPIGADGDASSPATSQTFPASISEYGTAESV